MGCSLSGSFERRTPLIAFATTFLDFSPLREETRSLTEPETNAYRCVYYGRVYSNRFDVLLWLDLGSDSRFESRLIHKRETLNKIGVSHSKVFSRWTGGDLNPRPSACEADSLAGFVCFYH